jgi:hypothetical protein
MEGILIGTAILWVLSAVLVVPLTNGCVKREMVAAGVAPGTVSQLPLAEQRRWRRIATVYYILWDILVLGGAGFVGGLLGFWFVGISFEPKGWPGILAFVGASFLGLSLSQAPRSI